MKFFRTHITRLTGFLMLMLGIMLHYALPQEQKQDNQAFTNWLGSHLKTNDEDVLSKIDALNHNKESLETVIRKASELVYNHSDDFKLPVSEDNSEASDEVFQILLTEWNYFRSSGSGMGKAVFIENVKSQTILLNDVLTYGHASKQNIRTYAINLSSELYIQEFTSLHNHILSPHKSGTAIGAP